MHDAAYKLLFSHRRMVADLLRGFLADGASPGFDFDTLEPLPASHVGRGLRRRDGDLMWRLRARAAPDDGWVYVLVLLEFQSSVDRHMALRVLTYTGLAWEGLLRTAEGSGGDKRRGNESGDEKHRGKESGGDKHPGKESGGEKRPPEPLPPVIPFVVYNGSSSWTAPLDVSELIAPMAPSLGGLQPANRYVLLDLQRAEIDRVPEDNAVGLQAALEQTMFEESAPILRRVDAVLAGPEHAELRKAFAAWLRQLWADDYGALTAGDEALSRELDRLANAGEVEAMRSLAAERWKERNRKREAQILARGVEQGMARGRTQGREEGLAFHRRQLGSLAARRFGADTGESLSALLADVSEPQRLTAVGDAIIDCATGAELLATARRIVGTTD